MTRQLMILLDAVTACGVAARIATACADGNSNAALGWAMTIMWIFIDMTNRIFGLRKGGAE